MVKKRKPRHGEHTCYKCGAYSFPHRFGGGKCVGINVVEEQWNEHGPFSEDCKICPLRSYDGISYSCEVLEGSEVVDRCQVFQDYVYYHEIKIYPKWSRA